MDSKLISGDPLAPCDTDLIAQTVDTPLKQVPPGPGWRILTGSLYTNLWGRIAYRYEIERG